MANYEFTEFPIPATPIASVGDIASADGILVVKNGSVYKIPLSSFLNAVGAVPTTRKVNSKALSSNISLSASDVGAVPTTALAREKIYEGSWQAPISTGNYTLSKDVSNYTYLEVWSGFSGRAEIKLIPVIGNNEFNLRYFDIADATQSINWTLAELGIRFSGTTMTVTHNSKLEQGNTTTYGPVWSNSPASAYIYEIYGIKFLAN